jgi:hypothetical protein
MRNKILLAVITLFVATVLCTPRVSAEVQTKNKGLFVTPVREYVDIAAGQSKNGTMTIANITDDPIIVTLSVEQFSVADYTYDYTFNEVKEDWIKFQSVQVALQPNKSQNVPYTIAVPTGATPGGHYFTLFATASLGKGTVTSTVRAATVLYVTVNGQLQRTSTIEKETIPWISFGGDIPFTLNVRSTGNTHFFTYVSGRLSGIFVKQDNKEETHILLPGTVRTIGSSIAAPLLPGVYPATYGYKTDDGQWVNKTKYVVYLPPWAIAIPIGGIWMGVILLRRHKDRSGRAPTGSSQPRHT